MEKKYEILKANLAEWTDIGQAISLLNWDQETNMPPGAAQGRAQAQGTLSRIAHEKATSAEYGKLLEELLPWAEGKGRDSEEYAMLREAKRGYDLSVKLPASFVQECSETSSAAMVAWREAKKSSDFPAFKPHLQKVVEQNRRKAQYLGFRETPYDALLDIYEPGMTKATVAKAFAQLRSEIVPVFAEIRARKDAVSNKILTRSTDTDKQFRLTQDILKAMDYDFNHGRQDRSTHPFTTSIGPADIRVTTWTDKKWIPAAIYASIHEGGHALYEQGIDPAYHKTALGGAASLGTHESQSRLWENIVGRSEPFCKWLLPQLKAYFPAVYGKVTEEELYRAVNKSEPSFIRVEADEVSYNLHILLRFEIESGMLEGTLSLDDAPEAWNAKMKEYLGITPKKASDGILQDVHWSMGAIGYFPTYTLGNIMSAQFYEQAKKSVPGMEDGFARGDFKPLLGWLRQHVHRHGSRYRAAELLEKAGCGPLDVKPFAAYIRNKYSKIYGF